ncbi:MAG: superoxide dismutase [Streptosporangiales bacterium]|nr:superoxide dismutase [Streptosporangiales bacterium]
MAAGAVAVLPVSGAAAASSRSAAPTLIRLPDGFQPEGITIKGHFAYVGSLRDGSIYRADLRTGEGRIISMGPGTPSVGLKIDDQARLWVSGRANGARVVDSRTGTILMEYTLATATPTFVNDVVLTPRAAWFTDSLQPTLYGLPFGRGGSMPSPDAVVRLPLGGDWNQVPDVNNANGIARTPDGEALLVVQSATGLLHRVDPKTGATRVVDLGGEQLTNGDGLLVIGTTLYVVQNRLNTVSVFRLASDGSRGTLQTRITDPRFDVPTTVAATRDRLYLPNARFGTEPTPETRYDVVAVGRR